MVAAKEEEVEEGSGDGADEFEDTKEPAVEEKGFHDEIKDESGEVGESLGQESEIPVGA